MLPLLLACHPDLPEDDDPPACEDGRCASLLATASLDLPWGAGRGLAVTQDVVLIVTPGQEGTETAVGGGIVAASLPEMEEQGRWTAGFGLGEIVQVNPSGLVATTEGGVVYLLEGLPSGREPLTDAVVAELRPEDQDTRLGGGLLLSETELLVLDMGYDYGEDRQAPGGVYAFALPLQGEFGPEDATRQLHGVPWYGGAMTWWDADGDGVDDLMVDEQAGLACYPGPWEADLVPDDATARWTGLDNGSALENLGDLDGDGLAELGFASTTWPGYDRRGSAWLLRGGAPTGGPIEEVTDQIQGDTPTTNLGTDLASGDLDGDGQPELLVGVGGLGYILAFAGPAGALVPSDAFAYVRSDRRGDQLGWELLATDVEGDGMSEVISCEQQGDDHTCWLLPGSAWR